MKAMDTTDDFYPLSPADVPAKFASPSLSYRVHACLAGVGLLLFVIGYVALTGWFGRVAYVTVANALEAGSGLLTAVLFAAPAAFFCAFLTAGALAVKNHRSPLQLEIREQDEPRLFAFLRRLAKEARAPMPHRVFLSPQVNAGVFYDVSLLNLVFPTRKNLELGLGLVEVLTLDELKAVLAHEFGHFAQGTMALGRWTYLAQQIAANIVASRGAFDRLLRSLAHFDLRVAWVGWLMQLLVWSVRAVLDTSFRAVVLAGRALGREMELQADLVAVSLTGSDSLIHALQKLRAADDSNARALAIAHDELAKGRPIEDLFAVQKTVMSLVRAVLGDPSYGEAPAVPEQDRAQHRLFSEQMAQPPKMWATHPPNREREDNAKSRYLPSKFDERPSWILFSDPSGARQRVTRQLLSALVNRPIERMVPTPVTLELVVRRFERIRHHLRYRGRYLGPSIVRAARSPGDLFRRPADPLQTPPPIESLYPERLRSELERWQQLEQEHALLVALQEGALSAPGGMVRHRGRDIRRRDLPQVIERVAQEKRAAAGQVLAHDVDCRLAHALAARGLGPGWEEYLRSLVALLHYADHTLANVEDAAGHLQHVFTIVTADGRVSRRERRRLVDSAFVLHSILGRVLDGHLVGLPPRVAGQLGISRWSEALPRARIEAPIPENIGAWLEGIGPIVNGVSAALDALSEATLDALLEGEEYVAYHALAGKDAGEAPPPARVPDRYDVIVPGEERPRQKRLDLWDRVQVADGVLPGLVRLSVAGLVLGTALALSGWLTSATVHIYNGLPYAVSVRIDDAELTVRRFGHESVKVVPNVHTQIVTHARSDGSLVESFERDTHNTAVPFVYNVAAAASMTERTAVYGRAMEVPMRAIGHERWFTSDADLWFVEPPRSVWVPGRGATRTVLSAD